MEIRELKKYILENNKVPIILENLGCHHIRLKSDYYTCGNYDGDNIAAITIYLNDNLTCINYTRDITQGKRIGTDIFSLVEFVKQCSFFEAIKLVCNWLGIDCYYNFNEDIPESLRLTKLIMELQKGEVPYEKEKPLRPISDKILTYYKPYVNDLFYNDGIDYLTQKEFEVGYDPETNRITIPIRDEYGNLVGVKGRLFKKDIDKNEDKYIYLETCARNQILYGLYKTYPFIKQSQRVFIYESEKGTMQSYAYGCYNCVSTCGKKISNCQIEKLTRLCVDIVLGLDQDVHQEEVQSIANRFIDGVNVYAIIDDQKILDDKESPTDNKEKFEYLIHNCIYKIK